MAHHSWSGLGVALLFMVGGAGADDAVMLPPTWVAYEAGRTVHAETAETVIVAPDGVVTMVGTAWLPSTSDDVLVARYGPDGTPLWIRRLDGPEHGSDQPGGSVPAPDGGLWCAVQHFLQQPRVSVLRLDAGGEIVWSTSLDVTPADGVPASLLTPRIAVDLEHGPARIYVTVGDGGAYRVVRLADDGAVVWDMTWTSGGAFGDRPTDLAVGTNGDTCITGRRGGSTDGYGTIGVTPDGTLRFAHTQFGTFGAVLTDPMLRAHPDGGVVVAGSPETACGTFEIRAWRLDENGDEQWDVTFGEQPCGVSFGPTALDVSADGRTAVTASAVVGAVGWLTVVFDDAGEALWSNIWLNHDSGGDIPYALAFDAGGGVIVTGMHQSLPTLDAFGVIRYAPDGEPTWSWTASNPVSGAGRAIAVGDDGAVVIGARSYGGAGVGERAVTMRFDPPPPPCDADLTGDGAVGADDLAALLAAWATAGADLDGDGDTGASDLAILLAAWGPC